MKGFLALKTSKNFGPFIEGFRKDPTQNFIFDLKRRCWAGSVLCEKI